MGDPACYRRLCPACDAQLTVVEAECPECGHPLPDEDAWEDAEHQS